MTRRVDRTLAVVETERRIPSLRWNRGVDGRPELWLALPEQGFGTFDGDGPVYLRLDRNIATLQMWEPRTGLAGPDGPPWRQRAAPCTTGPVCRSVCSPTTPTWWLRSPLSSSVWTVPARAVRNLRSALHCGGAPPPAGHLPPGDDLASFDAA